MVMVESLHECCPEAHVHVLCLSEECRAAMEKMARHHVTLLSLTDLEKVDPELAAVKPTRGLVEYYFTLTPCLPWHLLTRCGLGEVTCLDADMLFFSSPEPLFAEAGDASVIITPHRFPPQLKKLKIYGKYNVSWLTFRNTDSGLSCLSWYRASCLEWCRDVVEETRFADQKYLDVFPEKFSGIHVMRHLGGGLAPWNLDYARLAEADETFFVGGDPLIFYHAQGMKHIMGPFYSSGLRDYSAELSDPVAEKILRRYIRAYAEATATARQLTTTANFSGIRTARKNTLRHLRNIKRILEEIRRCSLIWL
jgi:hypothetical protein